MFCFLVASAGYCSAVLFFFVCFISFPASLFYTGALLLHTAEKQKNKAPNNPSDSSSPAVRLCGSVWLERCLVKRPNHITNKTKDY